MLSAHFRTLQEWMDIYLSTVCTFHCYINPFLCLRLDHVPWARMRWKLKLLCRPKMAGFRHFFPKIFMQVWGLTALLLNWNIPTFMINIKRQSFPVAKSWRLRGEGNGMLGFHPWFDIRPTRTAIAVFFPRSAFSLSTYKHLTRQTPSYHPQDET